MEWRECCTCVTEQNCTNIRKVSAAGITIKVNTVLVIGINDNHIEDIAKTVKAAGASIYNIISLIPQNELKDYPEPTCAQIESVDKVEVVTPDMLIGNLVLFHPETADLLFSIGLHCLGCPSSGVETISEAAAVHRLETKELVCQLNNIIRK